MLFHLFSVYDGVQIALHVMGKEGILFLGQEELALVEYVLKCFTTLINWPKYNQTSYVLQ